MAADRLLSAGSCPAFWLICLGFSGKRGKPAVGTAIARARCGSRSRVAATLMNATAFRVKVAAWHVPVQAAASTTRGRLYREKLSWLRELRVVVGLAVSRGKMAGRYAGISENLIPLDWAWLPPSSPRAQPLGRGAIAEWRAGHCRWQGSRLPTRAPASPGDLPAGHRP